MRAAGNPMRDSLDESDAVGRAKFVESPFGITEAVLYV
jgi:hypothetical protein